MNFHLRDATAADLDGIIAIDAASFAQPWARTTFESAMADVKRRVFVVAETDGVVGGYGVAWSIGDEGEIETIAVDAARRGQGLGKAVMQALIARLAERGAHAIFLEVRPSNTGARRLYEGLKFTKVGERPNYYNDGESAIIMYLDLDD